MWWVDGRMFRQRGERKRTPLRGHGLEQENAWASMDG